MKHPVAICPVCGEDTVVNDKINCDCLIESKYKIIGTGENTCPNCKGKDLDFGELRWIMPTSALSQALSHVLISPGLLQSSTPMFLSAYRPVQCMACEYNGQENYICKPEVRGMSEYIMYENTTGFITIYHV